jgi:lipopolysaccharide transport system permease protein
MSGIINAIKEPEHSTQDNSLPPLPDKPMVVIEPEGLRVALNILDLWAYRDLIYFLVWRDVKVRYKQTLLGIAWALLQPLLTMLIFAFIFGRLARIQSGDVPYQLFVFAGLVPWIFFSNAVINSANSLVGNANLITKVYFPRLIIPASAILSGLIDFAIGFAMLMALNLWNGYLITLRSLMLPVLVLLTTLLALGVGTFMSAINVRYRDVRYALPFVIQIWMFLSPIIYPMSLLPDSWKWTFSLNPLAAIIEGYRSAMFNLPFDWAALGVSTALTMVILVVSSYIFRWMERSFAEVV